MTEYENSKLLIGGLWRDGAKGATLPVLNPATEEVIGTVAKAEISDLDEALAAAASGFAIWRALSAFERSKIMRRAAALLRDRVDGIARSMTMEQGKPIGEARMEVLACADVIDWFAEEARRAYGRFIPARQAGVMQITLKLPVGPVAAFTPWNFPINQAVRKVSAALAAGCSVILKAAEETPASAVAMIRAFTDAGVPNGVLNLVFGVPAEISNHLIAHPVIQKISFTGSTAVGKQLAALAGQHMKRATMELGGHAPVIVTDDADLDKAVNLMLAHKFRNAGQVCVSPTRFLVQDGLADTYIARFAEGAEKINVGDGLADGTTMGPLANGRRIPALDALVSDAVERGGTLVTGGHRIGNKGYFYAPTVLADVPTDARIMNEEPFGPVAIINRWASLDAAIAEANRLPVGLAAYAFTARSDVADRLGVEVNSGMLSINHLGIGLPEVPFGGVQDSGYGTEGGADAMEPYLVTRFVTRA